MQENALMLDMQVIAHQLLHDAPVPSLDAASTRTLTSDP
jgi:hypothetical protein